jgi:transcriptional regulator PpsR
MSALNEFHAPERTLAGLDAAATATLIAAAADVALIVDEKGVIRDVSVGSEDLVLEGYRKWVGRSWAETVTVESRPKVAELLRDVATKSTRRWRHLNHPSSKGADVPVLYSAVAFGKGGDIVAFGRDMRSLATLQQRLVDAQQSMERDYLRLRHMETRYRLLFQMGSEPVMIIDAETQRIVEANPAAARLLADGGKRLVGRLFSECFEPRSRRVVGAMLARVPSAGRTEEYDVRLLGTRRDTTMSASLFKQEDSTLFLVRLALPANDASAPANSEKSMLLRALETVPDGFVVTDVDGRVISANAAFLEMTELTSPDQLHGESIDRWLGRSGVDLSVLLANLRQQGTVRLFATTMCGQYGATTQVEISATAVPHDEHPCLGFMVRDVGRRLGSGADEGQKLPRSVGQLTKLVGRVPLKDIVGETTDMIEKLCIEAALELTRDNRASAAEMLGLSRQSLYVKLRRFGLGDLGGSDADT